MDMHSRVMKLSPNPAFPYPVVNVDVSLRFFCESMVGKFVIDKKKKLQKSSCNKIVCCNWPSQKKGMDSN